MVEKKNTHTSFYAMIYYRVMLRNSKIGQPHGYLGFTVNHPDKCKVVTAGKAELQNYDYILSNTTLEHVEKEKDIGVTIDSKLTFEHHMNGYCLLLLICCDKYVIV
jgi:hypothetical protein